MTVRKIRDKFIPLYSRWIRLTGEVPVGNPSALRLADRKPDEGMIPLKNIRVLVAEDDPFNQTLMKSLLRVWKVHADVASNGAEAISLLLRRSYDMVLMDMEMPVLNGFDATSLIRNELNLNVPVVAITANVHPADRQRAFDSGVSDFLAKPFGHADLRKKILSNLGPVRRHANLGQELLRGTS